MVIIHYAHKINNKYQDSTDSGCLLNCPWILTLKIQLACTFPWVLWPEMVKQNKINGHCINFWETFGKISEVCKKAQDYYM